MSGGQTVESRALRVAVADDAVLLREGIGQILRAGGMEVVASVDTAEELLRAVGSDGDVDAIVLDIKMPPTHTDEGLRALERLRADGSRAGILLLSMYTTASYAIRAMSAGSGTGYLLKDRVADADTLVTAVRTVARGGSVVDPEVVQLLVTARSSEATVEALSSRERDVLRLMAEGRSNVGIATELHLSLRTVESHIGHIMAKLGVEDSAEGHRRVLAVLRFLGRDS
ncbi:MULTISPECIES: response regulator transcription factor [Leifsonia]|uniref:DNA-binding NarL/FixJ family response regulator n=1 Tax=Leifsonia soli TaxID=582665 RepID=A0A852T142_9MICO|nr:response regulator transcription factor [Leifsonia sp. 21MFCrub1.1]NYD74360.1 DNA-binding NarL/FixJ family response regulator [Leifsonia soli]SEA58140.1 DNA-binding response regulator, NarL/FixJ family, contains REC and HTH domains [Leifsonia sp. 21MFCrub1.1]